MISFPNMTSVAESVLIKEKGSRRAALTLVLHYFALKLSVSCLQSNWIYHVMHYIATRRLLAMPMLISRSTERNIRWSVRHLSDQFLHSNDLHHRGRWRHQVRLKHRFVSTRLLSITSEKTVVFRAGVSTVSPLVRHCAKTVYMRPAKRRETPCSPRTAHWCVLQCTVLLAVRSVKTWYAY